MIIPTDLRLAIKSAERAQNIDPDYEQRRKARRASIEALFKRKPAIARRIKHARKQITEATAIIEKAQKVFDQIGLYAHRPDDFRNEDTFVAAGGILPNPPDRAWKFDEVMKELAGASAKEGAAILKRIGINWA